jgi:hypothetical protein
MEIIDILIDGKRAAFGLRPVFLTDTFGCWGASEAALRVRGEDGGTNCIVGLD